MSDPTVPADGTRVRVNRGAMVGVPEGTPAVVRHQAPGGHSNLPRLVWLELEEPIQWSHGQSEHPGFWASPVEFTVEPVATAGVEMVDLADLATELERISPSSMAAHLDPTRPYDGQPHTDLGERGRQQVHGLTMRDLRDCFIRACYESSGLSVEKWPGSVFDLPDLDLIAVAQNLTCNVEKAMGIYPNVPRLLPADPTEPHWCGPDLDSAVWSTHEGHCDTPVNHRAVPIHGRDR